MSRTPKEAIYDSQIGPLIDQIIATCKQHKIAMLSSFDLGTDPDDEDSVLACTTAFLADECEPSDRMLIAMGALMMPDVPEDSPYLETLSEKVSQP